MWKEEYTVCHFKKSLYGVQQAPTEHGTHVSSRSWSSRASRPSDAPPGLYIAQHKDGNSYLLVYVDDVLIAAKDMTAVASTKEQLTSIYETWGS